MGAPRTRDGRAWEPAFLLAIDESICIGCDRCYKVCRRGVMTVIGVTDEGEFVDADDDGEEIERKVMCLIDAGACIGCGACARVCLTNCQTHDTAN